MFCMLKKGGKKSFPLSWVALIAFDFFTFDKMEKMLFSKLQVEDELVYFLCRFLDASYLVFYILKLLYFIIINDVFYLR